MCTLIESVQPILATDFPEQLLETDKLIPLVAIVFGCSVAVVAIVAGAIKGIAVGRARERTKRELAAYVAEGTLDADKAVAMIDAGKKSSDCC